MVTECVNDNFLSEIISNNNITYSAETNNIINNPSVSSPVGNHGFNNNIDWDINDSRIPTITRHDEFQEWPDGHCKYVYSTTNSEPAKRHTSGWAMRNTNNHNVHILKKSCLGVIVCSLKCQLPSNTSNNGGGGTKYKYGDNVLRLRPAICDKARKKQQKKSCPNPKCNGKLEIINCRGHCGYPVTHFWRHTEHTIFFQAKGIHDHPKPETKITLETRKNLSGGINSSSTISNFNTKSTSKGESRRRKNKKQRESQPTSYSTRIHNEILPQNTTQSTKNLSSITSTPKHKYRSSQNSQNHDYGSLEWNKTYIYTPSCYSKDLKLEREKSKLESESINFNGSTNKMKNNGNEKYETVSKNYQLKKPKSKHSGACSNKIMLHKDNLNINSFHANYSFHPSAVFPPESCSTTGVKSNCSIDSYHQRTHHYGQNKTNDSENGHYFDSQQANNNNIDFNYNNNNHAYFNNQCYHNNNYSGGLDYYADDTFRPSDIFLLEPSEVSTSTNSTFDSHHHHHHHNQQYSSSYYNHQSSAILQQDVLQDDTFGQNPHQQHQSISSQYFLNNDDNHLQPQDTHHPPIFSPSITSQHNPNECNLSYFNYNNAANPTITTSATELHDTPNNNRTFGTISASQYDTKVIYDIAPVDASRPSSTSLPNHLWTDPSLCNNNHAYNYYTPLVPPSPAVHQHSQQEFILPDYYAEAPAFTQHHNPRNGPTNDTLNNMNEAWIT